MSTNPSDTDAALIPAMRNMLLAAMREWSQDTYCAGWLIDLEERLHRDGSEWAAVARLTGWPIGCEAEGGWETWEEAAARYASAEWHAARPWLTATPTEEPA